MEYIYDEDDDMTMQNYFKKYKDKLPDLIIVSGGYYGLTQYDDYATDQVIRFTTYSSQERVIARDSSGAKSAVQLEYLNIPVDTRYRFRVVHGPRQIGPDERLSEILKKHEIPILVRFVDTMIPELSSADDPRRRRTNYLIIKKFEENYLLGNCVTEGVVNASCTTAGLTKNIFVSRITGIKGKSDEEFERYLADMDEVIKKKTKFNLKSGNPSSYTELVDMIYNDILSYFCYSGDMTKIVFNSDDTGTGASMDPDDPLIPKEVVFLDNNSPPPPVPPRQGSTSQEEEGGDYTYIERLPKGFQQQQTPSPKMDKDHKTGKTAKHLSDIPPELPPRPVELEDSTTYEIPPPDIKVPYENDVQRCVVNPTTHVSDFEGIYTVLPDENPNESDITEQAIATKSHTADLTIDNIGEVLKKLQLGKYVSRFKEQMIDGTILQELKKDDFVIDFKFTNVEAIRLMKFIKTGHIPR